MSICTCMAFFLLIRAIYSNPIQLFFLLRLCNNVEGEDQESELRIEFRKLSWGRTYNFLSRLILKSKE